MKNRPGICGCQSEIRVHVAPPSVVFADDSSPPRYTVLRDESPGSTRTIWLYSGWDCIRSIVGWKRFGLVGTFVVIPSAVQLRPPSVERKRSR